MDIGVGELWYYKMGGKGMGNLGLSVCDVVQYIEGFRRQNLIHDLFKDGCV